MATKHGPVLLPQEENNGLDVLLEKVQVEHVDSDSPHPRAFAFATGLPNFLLTLLYKNALSDDSLGSLFEGEDCTLLICWSAVAESPLTKITESLAVVVEPLEKSSKELPRLE